MPELQNFEQDKINELFPTVSELVDAVEPVDGQLLLQLQYEPKYVGAIALLDDTAQKHQLHKTCCKVVKIGTNAFVPKQNPNGRPWIDLGVGDFVLSPSMQGRRIRVPHPTLPDGQIHFIICNDVDIELKILNPVTFNSLVGGK